MKTKLVSLLAGLVLLGMAGAAGAVTQAFDFEAGGAGTTSTDGYATLGWGNYYLWSPGTAVTQTFTQTGGNTVDLTFNLAIIDTWDGTSASWGSPDYFNVALDGNIIFRETFINYAGLSAQTYNASAPITWGQSQLTMGNYHPDSAYLITLNGLASSAGTHTLTFFADGAGWQGSYNPIHPEWIPNPYDESFGVDNITVTYQGAPVPEPATFILLGAGLAGLGLWRRRVGR